MTRKQKMKAEQIGNKVKIESQAKRGNRTVSLEIPEGLDGILLLVTSEDTLLPSDLNQLKAGNKNLQLSHVHRLSLDVASERADFDYLLTEGRGLENLGFYAEMPIEKYELPVDDLYGFPSEDEEGNDITMTWRKWKAGRLSVDKKTMLVSLSRKLSDTAWTSTGCTDSEAQLHRTRFTDAKLLIQVEYEELIQTVKYRPEVTGV